MKKGDAEKIKESEIPQLLAWLGKETIDCSFAISAEEVLGQVRDCDWGNMHMRERHVVEADPHDCKPLPEPTELQIWEAIMKTANFSKVFRNPSEVQKRNLFQTASESGVLRGLQRFHHRLNEKVSALEQREDANEMEVQFPLEMGDTRTDEHGETIREVGKPRVKMEDGTTCLLYTSPSPRDLSTSRMPSSA